MAVSGGFPFGLYYIREIFATKKRVVIQINQSFMGFSDKHYLGRGANTWTIVNHGCTFYVRTDRLTLGGFEKSMRFAPIACTQNRVFPLNAVKLG